MVWTFIIWTWFSSSEVKFTMFLSPPLSSTFNVTCHALVACTKEEWLLNNWKTSSYMTHRSQNHSYLYDENPGRTIHSSLSYFYFEVGNYSVISHLTESHLSLEETGPPLQGHSTGAPVALALFSMEPLPGFVFPLGALLHWAGHSWTPILCPGPLSVLKAFLL